MRLSLLALLITAALTAAGHARDASRVVSINLCTDQLAMVLAQPGQLASVSFLAADANSSALANEARAYPLNYGSAEEIFAFKPTLVLAGTYTTRATIALLKRLGIAVEEFAPETSLADVRGNILRMGALLGREEQAAALAKALDSSVPEARSAPTAGKTAVIYMFGGYTPGANSLAGDVVRAAGYTLANRAGGKVPLETLLLNPPHTLILGSAASAAPVAGDALFRHPALKAVASSAEVIPVPDRYWQCGGPWTAQALKLLSRPR
jgi:iron complex transport system substrate-binding protein